MSNGNGTLELEALNTGSATDAIYGSGLMQTRSPYSTAVQVIKPRNMELVEKRCVADASIAGDSFLYQWDVKEKQPDGTWKKKPLIGLSIGAALSIARNMGNNAIDVNVEEKPDSYLFYAAYIDLETGFNLRRAFRQRKTQKSGNYSESGRSEDITFQIGQSKAIRNVALNAAPVWLTERVLETAKNSFADKVEKDPEKYKKSCITLAGKLSIPIARVEAKYGKIAGWDARKIVSCLMELRTVEDGLDDVANVFPEKENQEPEAPKEQPKAKAENKAPENVDKTTGEILNTEPEIESAGVVEEPKEEKKSEPAAGPAYDDNDPANYENPKYFIWKMNQIQTAKEWTAFRKQHNKNISQFTGNDHAEVMKVMNARETQILKSGK